LRITMIFLGTELIQHFHWVIYFFGAFLVYTAVQMFRGEQASIEPDENVIVRFVTRYVPITRQYDRRKFFTMVDGKRVGTLLLLVLIVVEVTDLVFAVDSIPAIFGITTDRFIVYTSNIFAILGLRTFFFLLVDMAERFYLLKYGLAFVLSFIGIKMLLPLAATGVIFIQGDRHSGTTSIFLNKYLDHVYDQAVINLSLGIVAGALVVSVVLSVILPQKE